MKFVTALSLFFLIASSPFAAPQEPEARYVRSGAEGAKLRNLADPNGRVLFECAAEGLMRVHGEHRGWLEVELAGGLPVWVYGRYLKETPEEGVLEVTRDAVNMRAKPNSDVGNFPLSQRLRQGDRVRMEERADESRPLESDWVRVWSPPGTRAWVQASDVQDLAAGEDGAALWAEASGRAPRPARPAPRTETESAGEPPAPAKPASPEAQAALAAANRLYDLHRGTDRPDYQAIRAAYDRVITIAPESASAIEAARGLEAVAALEKAKVLEAQLVRERDERQRILRDQQERIWQDAQRRDPLGGERYQSRGVLERRQSAGGPARFLLRWGGEAVCELDCSTGRYDLDLFAGFELGVVGEERLEGETLVLDVRRIEVLSRR